jgi:hypothetical protein
VASGFTDALERVIQRATGTPRVVDLESAPAAEFDTIPVEGDFGQRLTAARDWLWRHPDDVASSQLRAGTQLGLAVTLLSEHASPTNWRLAAVAAIQCLGPPASGPAAQAARELGSLAAEARRSLHSHDDHMLGRRSPTDVDNYRTLPPHSATDCNPRSTAATC